MGLGEDRGSPRLRGEVSPVTGGCSPSCRDFGRPACSHCTLAAAWLEPVRELGERQRQVRSRSTSPAPELQAPSPGSAAGRESCSPPPASPALALGTGLQLRRAGSQLLLRLGFYSGKHLARTCILLKSHKVKHRITLKHNIKVLFFWAKRGDPKHKLSFFPEF